MRQAAAWVHSEHDEGLSDVTLNSLLLDSDDVESDGLGERSALADGHDITDSGTGEGGRQMSGHVVMSLLESVVLLDVVKVISAEHDGSRHLVGEDNTLEDSTSDGHVGGEGALLVDVSTSLGVSGGLETETDLLVVAGVLGLLSASNLLGVEEDTELLLESSFSLNISHV